MKLFKICPFKLIFLRRSSFFITTPIFYTNDNPHIGHLYTVTLADIISRWKKLLGTKVIFSTGTDDHGIKIQKAAVQANIPIKMYVHGKTLLFQNLFDVANIKYDTFVKTSEVDHVKTVQKIWENLLTNGYINKTNYSGWYSIVDECFVTNTKKETLEKMSSQYEWYNEENWVFDITQFKDSIKSWITSGAILPRNFVPPIINILNETNQISISRPSNRVSWGIPVPNDPDQTIYVWFDALCNYLTVSNEHGQYWPPDLQIIGKDIIRFHAVIWPAILLALNMELPKKLLIHYHWLKDGVKMSKSLGNTIDYEKESKLLGNHEMLKYCLVTSNNLISDSNYNSVKMCERINNDLVNILCNLVSRICSPKLNPKQSFNCPIKLDNQLFEGSSYSNLLNSLANLPEKFQFHMDNYQLHLAKDAIFVCLSNTNLFCNDQKPWNTIIHDPEMAECVVYVCQESVRICCALLQCFVPELCHKIFHKLNIPPIDSLDNGDILKFNDAPCEKRLINERDCSVMLLKRIAIRKNI